MEPAPKGGRDLDPRAPVSADITAAMEPAPKGGRDRAREHLPPPAPGAPQWSPPRRAGGTRRLDEREDAA